MEPYLLQDPSSQETDVVIEESPLRLNIDDNLLIAIIEKRMNDSEAFYKNELKLYSRQAENEKFWLGDVLKEDEMEPNIDRYKDNIIWQDSEKRNEIAAGRMPDIIITPSAKNMVARERAKLLEDHLRIRFEDKKVKRLIKDGLRQHGIYRLAAIKVRWDAARGEHGDYLFELVRPGRYGLDHTATISHDGFTMDNVELFWEYIEEPLIVTLSKFPAKADELKQMLRRGSSPNDLVSKIKYLEVHFTWYQNNGQPIEAVCWKYKDLILNKQKTPYFDYQGYSRRVYENDNDPEQPDRDVKSKL